MLQNYFEIKHGDKTVRRRNSINNPFVFYKEMRVMCSYIYIKYGDGQYLFKTPVLRGFNFDPDKGGLYASYETSIAADELDGNFIEAVGFSASAAELQIVNAVAAGVYKTPGEPLFIEGTMVLNTLGDNFALLPGDNKLVRMLLGTEAFSSAAISITCGTDNTPMEGYTYSAAVLPSSVTPVFENNAIRINKTFSLPVTDVVLLIGGAPVLRVINEMPTIAETKYISAPQNDFVTINVNDKVTAIEDLKVVTLSVDFTAVRLPAELRYKKEAKIKLPNAAVIKKDVNGRFFAYIKDGRAAAFTFLGAEVKINRFFACRDILPMEDGAVFVIKEDGEVFYAPTNTDGDTTGSGVIIAEGGLLSLGIKAGDKYAAVYKNGEYVFGTLINKRAVFYKITPASGELPIISVLSDSNSEDDAALAHVFALPDCVVVLGRTSGALCYGTVGAITNRKIWLDAIVDASWFSLGVFPQYDAGRLVLYNSYTDQSFYYINMRSTRYTFSGFGRFFGEFCIRYRGATGRTDVSAIGGLNTLESTEGRMVFAAAIGRFLYLFMESGAVRAYYVVSQSQKLYAGAITQGQTVSFVQRSVNPSAIGSVVLKIMGISD